MKNKHLLWYLLFIGCITLWSTLCFILPYSSDLQLTCQPFMSCIPIFVGICLATFLLLYLTALNKIVFAIFLPLYSIIGSIVVWGRKAYTAILTPTLVDAAIHSNMGSTMSLFSTRMCLWFMLNICICVVFVWVRYRYISIDRAWLHCIICIILLTICYNCNSKLTCRINSCYPYNLYHNVKLYLQNYQPLAIERSEWPTIAKQIPDTLDMLLFIGESCRADHLAINGYHRPTTPQLSARQNLVALPHIYTEFTHTMASVPHILTAADSLHHSRAYEQSSFIRCFKKYGFQTYWISNQDRGRTYSSFIAEADTAIFPRADKSALTSTFWVDGELLPPLQTILSEQKTTRNLYVMHGVGSHWYYNSHVPESLQQFKPITDNRIITQNTAEAIVNSYDNTILYLDHMLDSLMTLFEDRNAIIIYLADHGESLGENGHWLHATDSKAEQNPACVIWWSENYNKANPERIEALKENHSKPYYTDFLFHSILSAAGICSTDSQTLQLDIFTTTQNE